jgi:hypothetical protein
VHDLKKLTIRGQIHTSATPQPRKEPTGTHCIGDYFGSIAGMGALENDDNHFRIALIIY